MRHVWGNTEHFAGVDHDLSAVDGELQRAFENVSELLVDMAVLGNDASLLEKHAREHEAFSGHDLSIEKRVEDFEFNVIPADVLEVSHGRNSLTENSRHHSAVSIWYYV